MGKKALRKDFFMEIKTSFGRFMSIFFIVAIGVAFFSGIRAAEPDMRYSGDAYFDEKKLFDIQVISTLGLTEDDVRALKKVEGIKKVEYGYSIDALCQANDSQQAVHIMSILPTMNLLTVESGRLPEEKDECVVDADYLMDGGFQIGDRLTFRSGTDDAITDSLSTDTFTIVGTVSSPCYIGFQRGSTTIGTGSIAGFVSVPEESFSLDVYTEIYASVEGAEELLEFTAPYTDRVEEVKTHVEAIRKKQEDARYQEIIDEANEELDDAKKELKDAKKEAEKELKDARKKLDDGHRQLKDGKKKLDDSAAELENSRADLISGQNEVDRNTEELNRQNDLLNEKIEEYNLHVEEYNGQLEEFNQKLAEFNRQLDEFNEQKEEFYARKQEYEQGKAEYERGMREYEQNRQLLEEKSVQLDEGYLALEAGFQALDEGISELNGAKEQYQAKKAEYDALVAAGGKDDAALAALQAMAGQIAEGEARISATRTQLENTQAQLEAGKTELEAGKAQLEAGKAELDAAGPQLEEAGRQIAAAQAQIDEAQAQFDEGKAQLDDGQAQLDEGKAQLDDALSQLEDGKRQIQSGRAQLADAQAQINDGWYQLRQGEKKLADARAELAEKEQELKDAEKEYQEGKEEAEDKIADGEKEILDAEDEISKIEHAKWYINDRDDLPEHAGYGENADRMRAIGEVFPVLFFLVAALISLTTMTRMVEEQRIQIGTLKALGYERHSIAGKYLGYACLATVMGSIVGVLFGEKVFPYIIITAYKIMYEHIPNVVIPYDIRYALMASAAALACTLLATFFSCYRELREQSAELMRPPAPKQGKRVLLERVPFIWNRLNFTWKATIRNLIRYKKRFFMTIFGIGGCMALLLVGFGLKDSIFDIGFLQYHELQIYDGNIILNEDASRKEKTQAYEALTEDTRVEKTELNLLKQVTISNGGKKKDVYLNVPEDTEQFSQFVIHRDRITKETYTLDDEGVILTEKMAKQLQVQPGDRVWIKDDAKGEIEVRISSICENYMQHFLYMSPALYEEVHGRAPEYNSVYFIMKEGKEKELEDVGESVLKEKGALSASYTKDIESQLNDMLVSLNIVMVVLVISAGMLAFVVLYNLNNINITERKRELATLKVLGFYPGEVAQYVYRENVILTILGAFAGMVLGKFLHQFVIVTVEIDSAMFGRNIDFSSFVYGFLITVGFSAFVNFVMYFKLKKINMVESLKSVE
ncbi:MAG: FtsX-like permease family protein [Ruminococcus sp.]|uniref:FtsX-like permease family protein n=1 Tax=Schaedlerella arabinosiphila TaxID=2044587 RepID=UPI0025582286|nr:FtsX-like permease family protein [Schaedlerella arabinosiphila]MCI9603316.1 FtsX-like permease family protein [Ruminococcus sp.]